MLGAFALVFPAGYLFWWATAFSAGSATNALGPHYYVPAFVPLVILGADGIVHVARRDLRLAVGLGVLALVLTAYNLPDKVNGTRAVSKELRAVARAMPSDGAPSLVFVREDEPQSFTARIRPFLVNPPELDGPNLYPVDRAGRNAAATRPDA